MKISSLYSFSFVTFWIDLILIKLSLFVKQSQKYEAPSEDQTYW